jgi:membrane-associated protease RseP (regulator of RpoE activity)
MRNRKMFRATVWGLALGLVALAGAARAEEGKDKEVKKVQHRVVVVDKDGKRQVFEGDGMPLFRRGFLGVSLTDLTPELRSHFGVPEGEGAMVSKVEDGSPADKAGVKVGDILTSVDGQAIKNSWDVMAKVRRMEDGQQVPLEVWRNGRAQNLTATVVERERSELDVSPFFFKGGKDGEPLVFHMDRDKLQGWKPEDIEKFREKFGEGNVIRINPGEGGRLLVSPREAELEKKLKQLEKRIQELEQQLDRKN